MVKRTDSFSLGGIREGGSEWASTNASSLFRPRHSNVSEERVELSPLNCGMSVPSGAHQPFPCRQLPEGQSTVPNSRKHAHLLSSQTTDHDPQIRIYQYSFRQPSKLRFTITIGTAELLATSTDDRQELEDHHAHSTVY